MFNTLIASAANSHISIAVINSKELVEQARKYHNLYPTSCAALGRVLSITALLGLRQKQDGETVTCTIDGDGPIGNVICVTDNLGNVKGYCGDPYLYFKKNNSSKLDVSKAIGTKGYLRVAKDLKLKQGYTSQVELQTGEIGEDFAYYFAISEQTPCIVSVGVLVDVDYSVKAAGAMIIQLMPGHTEEDIRYLEELKLTPISNVLAENSDVELYLNSLFKDLVILEKHHAKYLCNCSKQRFAEKLCCLKPNDLFEILKDKHFEIKCEFCNKTYSFQEEDINKIIANVQDKKYKNQ